MDMITIGIIGIAAVLLAVPLKAVKVEYAVYLTAAAGCLICFSAVGKLKSIFDAMERLRDAIHINSIYLSTLLKMAGITYVAEFSSGICKDAGYGAIGSQIEVFGKLTILAVSMPVVLALMEVLQSFVHG